MEIILQFMRYWAFLFLAAFVTQSVLSFLARKFFGLRRTINFVLRLSVAIHEFFHYFMAKITGAEAKVEYIHAQEGFYQYMEANKTFMKSVLVAFGPSILGALILFEIQSFLTSDQSIPSGIVYLLWFLSVVVFFGIPSSAADIAMIFRTASEHPKNALASIAKLVLSILIYSISQGFFRTYLSIKSPYFELLLIGGLFLLLRLVLRVIPTLIYTKAVKVQKKHISHLTPKKTVKRYVNAASELPMNRSPETEFGLQMQNTVLAKSDRSIFESEVSEVPQYLSDLVSAAHYHLLMCIVEKPKGEYLTIPSAHALKTETEINQEKKRKITAEIAAITEKNQDRAVVGAVMIAGLINFREILGTPGFQTLRKEHTMFKTAIEDQQRIDTWFPILQQRYHEIAG